MIKLNSSITDNGDEVLKIRFKGKMYPALNAL